MDADVVSGGGDPGSGDYRGKVNPAKSQVASDNVSGHNLDVAYVARLARIELTAEETELFQAQLGQVLEHVAKLRELTLDGVEPAAHAFPIFDIWREDEPRPGFTQEEALRQAPRAANGLFIVPKVVE